MNERIGKERFFERFLLRDFIVQKRIECILINLVEKRRHDKKRQEQRDSNKQLVRRHLLRAERLTDEREHDDDSRERRHHDQNRRRQRQNRQEYNDLNRTDDLLRIIRRLEAKIDRRQSDLRVRQLRNQNIMAKTQ